MYSAFEIKDGESSAIKSKKESFKFSNEQK